MAFERSDVIIRQRLRETAMLLALIMLSACQIGTKISVNTVNGTSVFTVTRVDGDETCVQSIEVREGNGEIGKTVHWAIVQSMAEIQSGKAVCTNVFTYGLPVSGFEQVVGAKPLTPGASYTVSIGGAGLTGSAYFTVPR